MRILPDHRADLGHHVVGLPAVGQLHRDCRRQPFGLIGGECGLDIRLRCQLPGQHAGIQDGLRGAVRTEGIHRMRGIAQQRRAS